MTTTTAQQISQYIAVFLVAENWSAYMELCLKNFKSRKVRAQIYPAFAFSVLLLFGVPLTVRADETTLDPVILNPSDEPIRAGAYSVFAKFQEALYRRLMECQSGSQSAEHDVPGLITRKTSHDIVSLLQCSRPVDFPSTSQANKGALTGGLWNVVMGNVMPPSMQERIDALILSFEATDFGQKPEWNFCQDSEDPAQVADAAAKHEHVLCLNDSDPCSLLTWGPRGATAGQGQEIQQIIQRLIIRDCRLVQRAFGPEMPHVLRLLQMKADPDSCDGSTPIDMFMCAAWIDPRRRTRWERALEQLGQSSLTRDAFHEVYAEEPNDGYKIRAYYDLWTRYDLRVSEIDFAFFQDRATQIGAPPAKLDLSSCLAEQRDAVTRNAGARRCVARLHPHPGKPIDRLARDVVFYEESYPASALSADETEAWLKTFPLRVQRNFGLSDAVSVPYTPTASAIVTLDADAISVSQELTDAERNCPVAIRKPEKRRPASEPSEKVKPR